MTAPAYILQHAEQLAREAGRPGLSPRVRQAVESVAREQFVSEDLQQWAWRDAPLPIGHGQTISQPSLVAAMIDVLEPQSTDIALDIGTGSGYHAALLAKLVKQVYSVEIVAPLAEAAKRRFAEAGLDNIEVRVGDGRKGWSEHAPYNLITVAAEADLIPATLVDQLAPGGRMVIPVLNELMLLRKDEDGELAAEPLWAVAFVPLVTAA